MFSARWITQIGLTEIYIVGKLNYMVKFEQAFKNAVTDAKREVLVAQIRSHPEMTISELGKLSVGELGALLKQITVGDILGGGGGRGGRRRKNVAGGVKAAPKVGGAGKVNTRTQKGREAYDKAILEILKAKTEPVSAPQIKNEVGGTSLQIRTALNRLISQGHVTYTGKARGPRYQGV